MRQRLFGRWRVKAVFQEVAVFGRLGVGAEEGPRGCAVLVVGQELDQLAEGGHLVFEEEGQLSILLFEGGDELLRFDFLRLADLALLLLALAHGSVLVLGALFHRGPAPQSSSETLDYYETDGCW